MTHIWDFMSFLDHIWNKCVIVSLMKNFINTDIEFRKLAENIKIARKRRKLTLSELAIKASVSKTVLSRLESGDTRVGIGKVFNVLDALGLLKGLADIVSPQLDREQAFKEIVRLRDSKTKIISKDKFVRLGVED